MTIVPTMNFRLVRADSHVVAEALKWWKSSLAVNGMSADPINPNVTVLEDPDWIVFRLDGHPAFAVDRNSNDLSVHSHPTYRDTTPKATKLGTLLTLIEKWKRESRGSGPIGAPKYL